MIPEGFKLRMKALLGESSGDFINEVENGSAVRALRVNTLKITAEALKGASALEMTPLGFSPEGFVFAEEHIGSHPLHHAGAFYVQDPSAQAAVAAAREHIKPGYKVLDLCAAPGGKSGQLAALLCGRGFLLSNEVVGSRCRILRGNIERLGVKNAAVTSLETEEIAESYPDYFDFVLCDAPCSGEGMMRKYQEAVDCWSVENIEMCAERQKKILSDAAKCVSPGGFLLYSTCTFAPEENEENVIHFLASHPDFSLVRVNGEVERATSPGITPSAACKYDMSLTRRFYPHVSLGEGQFIALMRKSGGERESSPRIADTAIRLTAAEKKLCDEFFIDLIGKKIDNLVRLGDSIFISPDENITCPPRAVCFGVCAGSVVASKSGTLRFEPHHHLFSALGGEMLRRVELSADSAEAAKYLHGEAIKAEGTADGWCSVLISGCPVGGGKAVRGVVKNHYPKGLRSRNITKL